MGDDHESETKLDLQIHQLELCFFAQLLVERAKRFIEQQHFWTFRNGAGQGHTLALTARKLMRLALAILLKLHELKHFSNAGIDFRFCHAVLLETESYIVFNRHMREQRIGLEHHVYRTLIGRNAAHILTIKGDTTRCRFFKTSQHAHQRGLAATGRP